MPSDIIEDVLEEIDEALNNANIPNLARDIQKLHKQ